MNITFREVTKDDALGVEYVAAHSWKETYSGLLSDEYLDNRIKRINDDERIKKTKDFLSSVTDYFVVLDGDKIIGLLYVKKRDDKYSDYGYFNALYLLKEYQGLGIGKEMFKIGIKRLIDMGYDKMILECMEGNDTLNFYKKYGGYVVDTIDYPINDETVKADVLLFDDIISLYDKLEGIKRM